MDQVAELVEIEERGACHYQTEYESAQSEKNMDEKQMLVDTMKFVVAKLEDVSTRLLELENSRVRVGNATVTELFPANLPNSGSPGQIPINNSPNIPAPITSTPVKTSEIRIKPSDIKILELETLQRLDSAARLQMFFESVEQCTSNSNTRLEVAKSRVDGDLAVMVHTAQGRGEITSWNEFKVYLTQEFGMEMNFDQAWRQSDSFHYDWVDSPQSFVHKFKCHYAAIRGTFHQETLPDRDRLLKRKLLQGFPRNSRDNLEAFMDDNIPLNKFLGHVENERVLLLNTRASVNSVPNSTGKEVVSASRGERISHNFPQTQVNSQSGKTHVNLPDDNLSHMNTRLDQLQHVNQSYTNSPVARKYCHFCRAGSHSLRDCWRKPERGQCFDCFRYGCRRGNPSCPGRIARTNGTTPVSIGNSTPQTNLSSVRNTSSTVEGANSSVTEPSA